MPKKATNRKNRARQKQIFKMPLPELQNFPLEYDIEQTLPVCKWDNQGITGTPYVDHRFSKIFHDDICAEQYAQSAQVLDDVAAEQQLQNDLRSE